MLKKQRVTKVVGDLSDALDIAQAMLRSGEVEAARLHMYAAINNTGIDIRYAATDLDDYPPQYRAQFEAVAAVFERWLTEGVVGWVSRDDRRLEVRRRQDGAAWAASLTLTEKGLDMDEWCPDAGAISHCGGRVPDDEAPEATARAMFRAAGVQVPKP